RRTTSCASGSRTPNVSASTPGLSTRSSSCSVPASVLRTPTSGTRTGHLARGLDCSGYTSTVRSLAPPSARRSKARSLRWWRTGGATRSKERAMTDAREALVDGERVDYGEAWDALVPEVGRTVGQIVTSTIDA